jgi:hypothetical protein
MCSDGGQPVDDRPDIPLVSKGILVDNHGVPERGGAAIGGTWGRWG